MLLNLALPRINPLMTAAVIDRIYASVDEPLAVGDPLLDLTIDLSAAAPHDCPPISHFRLVIRDRAWLRRLDIAVGDSPAVGAGLALFSTERHEPLDGPPSRAVRVANAGIIPDLGWDPT